MKFTRRTLLGLLLVLLFTVSAAGLSAQEHTLALDPVWDPVTAGAATVTVLTGEIISGFITPPPPPVLNVQDINPFDRLAVFPYSGTLSTVSDITEYTAAVLPALLAIGTSSRDWLDIGVMYFEAAVTSYGLKNLVKLAVTRYRPYMYSDSVPAEVLAKGDYADSFLSGHTTMAFTGAAFLTYMFSWYHPKSLWIIPVAAGSYGAAAATAVLRVVSGNHFITDVLAGAVLGSLSGFLVPFFHMKNLPGGADRKVSMTLNTGIDTLSLSLHM